MRLLSLVWFFCCNFVLHIFKFYIMYRMVSKSCYFSHFGCFSGDLFTFMCTNGLFVFFDPMLSSFLVIVACTVYIYKRQKRSRYLSRFITGRGQSVCTGTQDDNFLITAKRITPEANYIPYVINLPQPKSNLGGFRKVKVLVYMVCYTKCDSRVYGQFGSNRVVSQTVLRAANAAAFDLATFFTFAYLRHFFIKRVSLRGLTQPRIYPTHVNCEVSTQKGVQDLLKTTRLGQYNFFDRMFLFRSADDYLAEFEYMHIRGQLNLKFDFFGNMYLPNEPSDRKRAVVAHMNNFTDAAHYCILSYNLWLDNGSLGAFAAANALYNGVTARLKAADITIGHSGFIVCNTIKFQNIFNKDGSIKEDNYYDENTSFPFKCFFYLRALPKKISKFVARLLVKKNK